MRLPAMLLLSLGLLLGGCDKDSLTLRFNGNITDASGSELDPAYAQAVLDILQRERFDLATINLALEGDSGIDVGFGEKPLSTQQRQRLQAIFGEVLEARGAWSNQLQLDIQEDKLDGSAINALGGLMTEPMREHWRKQLEQLPRHYPSQLGLGAPISLEFSNWQGIPDFGWVEVDADCKVLATLSEPLPNLTYQLISDGAPESMTMGMLSGMTQSVPSQLSFADPALQKLIDDLQPTYRLQRSKYMDSSVEGYDEILFDFGSQGKVELLDRRPLKPVDGLKAACERSIMAAGRPFAFFYGASIDRLESVEYSFSEP